MVHDIHLHQQAILSNSLSHTRLINIVYQYCHCRRYRSSCSPSGALSSNVSFLRHVELLLSIHMGSASQVYRLLFCLDCVLQSVKGQILLTVF